MTYGTILQTPNFPIIERWMWETDVQRSYNGTEDRIPLLRFPKRSFEGEFSFDSKVDLQRHLAMMTRRFGGEFIFPLFQYQSKLKASVSVGATSLPVTTRRLNLVEGEGAIILEKNKSEFVTINSISANALGLTAPIANDFTQQAIVCPFATVYPSENATVTRFAIDDVANSSFEFNERVPRSALLSAGNTITIDTFDNLPLLPYVPTGGQFDSTLQTGLQPVDYLAQNDLVAPWEFSQWNSTLTYMWTDFDRNSEPDRMDWWEAFADEIQGSCNPFLLSTNREDLRIVNGASPSGSTITISGTEYSLHYFAHDAFKRIAISTAGGVHYAKVTGITVIGGNDRLTFAPALPSGAEWGQDQRVSFLLKVRMADDKLTLTHYGLRTEVTLPVRTVIE